MGGAALLWAVGHRATRAQAASACARPLSLVDRLACFLHVQLSWYTSAPPAESEVSPPESCTQCERAGPWLHPCAPHAYSTAAGPWSSSMVGGSRDAAWLAEPPTHVQLRPGAPRVRALAFQRSRSRIDSWGVSVRGSVRRSPCDAVSGES